MCALPNRTALGTSESGKPTKCPLDGTWRAKAGDPPELAQDNPPPWSGGSTSSPLVGRWPAGPVGSNAFGRRVLSFIPPGLVVTVLAVLITSQLFYAFLPFRRRAYVPILVMTALGFALGQLWDYLGLPALRLGQADLVPAALFALFLQPLARFVPRPGREPREPGASNPAPPN
jgi:hypothetical protein